MPNNSDIQFITCPKCEGAGKLGQLGANCPNCAGMGQGSFLNKVFLYWGLKLGKATIRLRHVEHKINLMINLIAYVVGLAGLVTLGWWMYQTSSSNKLDLFFFWRFQAWEILIFWLGVLALMFIIYRLVIQEGRKAKIKKFETSPTISFKKDKLNRLPNNWDELKKYKGFRYKKLGRVGRLDVSQSYSREAIQILEKAFLMTAKLKQEVGIMHLFLAILGDHEAQAMFGRLNVDGRKLIDKIKKYTSPSSVAPSDAKALAGRQPSHQQGKRESKKEKKPKTDLSLGVREILIEAYVAAYVSGQSQVRPINFILPSLKRDEDLEEILYDLEVDETKLINVIEWFRTNDEIMANYRVYKKMARFKPSSTMDRAYTAVATPVLNHFGYDLVVAAKWGKVGICVARDKEIENIFSIFEAGQTGVMLAGPTGVGKKTIVHGVARLMVKEEVPKFLQDKRLIELDVARLISGATASQAGERLLVIIDEIAKAGNIILYINNIENLIGITAGKEASLDLSEVLVNALERKQLRCLGAATSQNYNKYIEGSPLANVMPKIDIAEPKGNQAIQIVESRVGFIEGKYDIYFSYNAIEAAVKLSDKLIHDKYLPAKAIDILERAAVKVSGGESLDKQKRAVTKEDVAGLVSEITKVPVQKITESEGEKLLNLEEHIHERMINQEEAVKMVSSSLRRARAEMREGKRPIASFLFLGPTGVGKTELAKIVASIYFGNQKAMTRVDMSEYQHPDSVKKMIGDSSGVTGYLTEAVRKKPFALILLDEFEKAHSEILNLFLQVMDDGRLTDGQGRTIDFTNSIIIATSNAGSIFIQKEIQAGTDIAKIKKILINEHLNKVMRPELINRFDGVIVFKPLSQENVTQITRLMLKKIRDMLEIKGMSLDVSPEGIKKLAQLGYDPKFGARPLRRVLQDKIEDIVANKIISGELNRRDTVVVNDKAEIGVRKGREL